METLIGLLVFLVVWTALQVWMLPTSWGAHHRRAGRRAEDADEGFA
jgi:hypothetical protein